MLERLNPKSRVKEEISSGKILKLSEIFIIVQELQKIH